MRGYYTYLHTNVCSLWRKLESKFRMGKDLN